MTADTPSPPAPAPDGDCQVCGGADFHRLVSQAGNHWWRCAGCGFAFLHPMPAGGDDDPFTGEDIGRDYIETYLGPRKAKRKMARSRERARRLKRRMPGPRLLDVGANVGFMVDAARGVGLDATGLEINPALVAFARTRYPDSAFLCGTLEDSGIEAAFDGLYCSEVIEHVPENNPFVAALARALRPGGVLFLTTPALHEYLPANGGAPARDFGAPDHKLYYGRDNIGRMLAKHGFTDIRLVGRRSKGLKVFAIRA